MRHTFPDRKVPFLAYVVVSQDSLPAMYTKFSRPIFCIAQLQASQAFLIPNMSHRSGLPQEDVQEGQDGAALFVIPYLGLSDILGMHRLQLEEQGYGVEP